MTARGPAVEIRDLTATHQRHPAVHHVSARFEPGSLTAIVGPNGAGKTTLLRSIAGLHRIDSGRVAITGIPSGASPRLALLPQQSGMDRAFPILCLDVVMQGMWSKLGAFGAASAADRDRAQAALEAVGLGGFARRPVGAMSAGQFQRLLFARLLVQDADLILLDEPFNAVDARTAADLLAVVRRWHGEGRTVMAVLHDMDLVRDEFPHCLLLARECVASGPTAEVLSAANRLRARRMAEAWDETAPACAA
ncbi:metal ABC transporter ATP-binding protein [Falsiroseomonas stagni]|uniref:Zinc/manganese transport system ATP-binding protein n=1 Tax=Falsiroseomonas stagni DSM 19981 TaxID=1123062 RepID=A0A1I4D7S1_9PROT|nr:ABC transporter ATP-binding protein [Falsiroseomonas stagni]SFK89648.1 zinc/manganese transport system ATP-binding protein [Falsiroseomonas stagni DSM 19981]